MKIRPDGQEKKVEKNIVDELHVNNVTRSVLDVEKNYRGFKISSQKDNCVNRNFTSILSKIGLFRSYFREPPPSLLPQAGNMSRLTGLRSPNVKLEARNEYR